jgi:hypothetical protein
VARTSGGAAHAVGDRGTIVAIDGIDGIDDGGARAPRAARCEDHRLSATTLQARSRTSPTDSVASNPAPLRAELVEAHKATYERLEVWSD